jgi:hypothetical protein
MLSRISGRTLAKQSAVSNVLKRGLAMPSRAHRATEAAVSVHSFRVCVRSGLGYKCTDAVGQDSQFEGGFRPRPSV